MFKRSLRAAAIFIAWLVVPLGVLMGLARAGLLAAMVPLLPLLLIIYPHDWFVYREAYSSTAVFSSDAASLIAIAQWVVATIAFSVVARRLSTRRIVWLAPLVIVAVGIFVLLLTALLGITVEADWL